MRVTGNTLGIRLVKASLILEARVMRGGVYLLSRCPAQVRRMIARTSIHQPTLKILTKDQDQDVSAEARRGLSIERHARLQTSMGRHP